MITSNRPTLFLGRLQTALCLGFRLQKVRHLWTYPPESRECIETFTFCLSSGTSYVPCHLHIEWIISTFRFWASLLLIRTSDLYFRSRLTNNLASPYCYNFLCFVFDLTLWTEESWEGIAVVFMLQHLCSFLKFSQDTEMRSISTLEWHLLQAGISNLWPFCLRL